MVACVGGIIRRTVVGVSLEVANLVKCAETCWSNCCVAKCSVEYIWIGLTIEALCSYEIHAFINFEDVRTVCTHLTESSCWLNHLDVLLDALWHRVLQGSNSHNTVDRIFVIVESKKY